MDLQKNLITLTTDFGSRDYFSGAMKGVVLGINPKAVFVDISHDVPSQDIWAAAYILGAAYKYFPQFAIHVIIVDPGVGSARRPILAVTDRHYFIAPDNGVLSFIYNDPGFSRVIHITADHYFLPGKGSTFHARDIFAPSAAWLSKGVEADKFGDEITDYVRFNIPAARKDETGVSGEVVYIDKFGNCITSISSDDIGLDMGPGGISGCKIQVNDVIIEGISPFYAHSQKGEAGAVINGNGYLEIFVNLGDAKRVLNLKRGAKVRLVLS